MEECYFWTSLNRDGSRPGHTQLDPLRKYSEVLIMLLYCNSFGRGETKSLKCIIKVSRSKELISKK